MRKKTLRTQLSGRAANRTPALQLQKETIRLLETDKLGGINGGITCPWSETRTEQTQMPDPTNQNN